MVTRLAFYLEKDASRNFLLGGSHINRSAIINFTMVTENVVSRDHKKDAFLLQLVQFSESDTVEWNKVAQTMLFLHFLGTCDTKMPPEEILRNCFGGKRREGTEQRHMLFSNRYKSESSLKWFVEGVSYLQTLDGVGGSNLWRQEEK